MNFTESINTCFNKYVTFSGRAIRSEFWWFVLFIIIGGVVAGLIDSMIFEPKIVVQSMSADGFNFSMLWRPEPITSIFSLVTFLPGISVTVRRLHDGNKSGWFYWIVLIPLIGWIMLIVWTASDGTDGENDFGIDPIS